MTALGVLCCFALFVCLTLLASFFLPSHLSFKNMYNIYTCVYNIYTCVYVHVQYLHVHVQDIHVHVQNIHVQNIHVHVQDIHCLQCLLCAEKALVKLNINRLYGPSGTI